MKAIAMTMLGALLTVTGSCAGQQRIDELTVRVKKMEEQNQKLDARVAQMESQVREIHQLLEAVSNQFGRMSEVGAALQRFEELMAGFEGANQPEPEPDNSVVYSVPVAGSPFEGPADAKVTIVKAFEFACPFCETTRPTLDQIRKQYGKDVRIVYKHFLVHGPEAMTPALAACAAHAQNKFSAMKDAIWDKGFKAGRNLGADHMEALAKGLKLNLPRFKRDMSGEACAKRVEEDQTLLSGLGVRGTPTFFINGRSVIGAQPIEAFRAVIDEELAKANEAISKQGIKQSAYYEHVVQNGQKSR